jgi:hypothetical protein
MTNGNYSRFGGHFGRFCGHLEYPLAPEVAMLSKREFEQYDAANPEVWAYFETFALEAAHCREHFSADAVLHRVRWETAIIGGDDGFKCNNNWTAFYARKFEEKYPQHAGFFRTRRQKSLTEETDVDAAE